MASKFAFAKKGVGRQTVKVWMWGSTDHMAAQRAADHRHEQLYGKSEPIPLYTDDDID